MVVLIDGCICSVLLSQIDIYFARLTLPVRHLLIDYRDWVLLGSEWLIIYNSLNNQGWGDLDEEIQRVCLSTSADIYVPLFLL